MPGKGVDQKAGAASLGVAGASTSNDFLALFLVAGMDVKFNAGQEADGTFSSADQNPQGAAEPEPDNTKKAKSASDLVQTLPLFNEVPVVPVRTLPIRLAIPAPQSAPEAGVDENQAIGQMQIADASTLNAPAQANTPLTDLTGSKKTTRPEHWKDAKKRQATETSNQGFLQFLTNPVARPAAGLTVAATPAAQGSSQAGAGAEKTAATKASAVGTAVNASALTTLQSVAAPAKRAPDLSSISTGTNDSKSGRSGSPESKLMLTSAATTFTGATDGHQARLAFSMNLTTADQPQAANANAGAQDPAHPVVLPRNAASGEFGSLASTVKTGQAKAKTDGKPALTGSDDGLRNPGESSEVPSLRQAVNSVKSANQAENSRGDDSKEHSNSRNDSKRSTVEAAQLNNEPQAESFAKIKHETIAETSRANGTGLVQNQAGKSSAPVTGADVARVEAADIKGDNTVKAPAAPIKELAIKLPGSNDRPVDLHITDDRGKLHVEVRTNDSQLASTLRDNVGDLVQKLDHSGYKAESVTTTDKAPVAAAASASGGQMGNDTNHKSGTNADSNQGQGGGNSGQQQQQQQGQGRGNRPRWLEEIARNFQPTVSEQEEKE